MNRKAVVTSLLFVSASLLVAPSALFSQRVEPSTHLTREQKEEFLRTARIVRLQRLSQGVTQSKRGTLTDGKITHDAHVQTVNIRKASYGTSAGKILNFIDSYKYNIAAYRLDRLLGLGMIPVSVERKVGGKGAAVTWWIDDMLMTEGQRKSRKIPVPNTDLWNKQMYRSQVFDQLIFNFDRNIGNLVITKDWRIHMIDHTRAFRLEKKLRSEIKLVQCDRKLLEALRRLTYEILESELRPYLTKSEVKALLTRRDLIIDFFDKAVAEKSEQAVLYDMPPRQ